MSGSDPIADMLTRVRNGYMSGLDVVEMPYSRMKGDITRLLKHEGYVADFAVEGGPKKVLRVYLKYTEAHQAAIEGLRRISKPGLRKYVTVSEIPRVLNGMGIAILSTSAGVVTDKEARRKGVGGELLCTVW